MANHRSWSSIKIRRGAYGGVGGAGRAPCGEAAKEFEQAAGRVSNSQLRSELLFHRDGYVADVAQASKQREEVLSAQYSMSRAWEEADALADGALNSADPSVMNRGADVFHDYVDTLRAVGWVDDAKAADKAQLGDGDSRAGTDQAPAAERARVGASAR